MPWRRLFRETFLALRTRGLVWGFALASALIELLIGPNPPEDLFIPTTLTSYWSRRYLLFWGGMVLSTFFSLFLQAATIHALRKRDAKWFEVLEMVWKQRKPLVGVLIVWIFTPWTFAALVMGPGAIMVTLGIGSIGPGLGNLYVIWIMAVCIAMLGVMLWLPWLLQSCVQEGRDLGSAIRRSWDVFLERVGTIFLIEALSLATLFIVPYILAMPFYLQMGKFPPAPIYMNMWEALGVRPLSEVGSTVSSTLTTAFTWTLYTLAWPYLAEKVHRHESMAPTMGTGGKAT